MRAGECSLWHCLLAYNRNIRNVNGKYLQISSSLAAAAEILTMLDGLGLDA